MVRAEALVDYGKFSSAKVAIFVDTTNTDRAYEILAGHGEAIGRIARFFSARVLLADEGRLCPERVVEDEVADAWILLVSGGRGRSRTTRNNPQRINVDTESDWEAFAFGEILRQTRESTRILEDVTSHYSRYVLSGDRASGSGL